MHPSQTATEADGQTARRGRLLGALLLLAGVGVNSATLGLLADDGEITGLSTTLMVGALQLGLIGLGALLLWRLPVKTPPPAEAADPFDLLGALLSFILLLG